MQYPTTDKELEKIVEDIVEQHETVRKHNEATRQLTYRQKWEVALILAAVIFGGITLLGFGGKRIVEEAARIAALSAVENRVDSLIFDTVKKAVSSETIISGISTNLVKDHVDRLKGPIGPRGPQGISGVAWKSTTALFSPNTDRFQTISSPRCGLRETAIGGGISHAVSPRDATGINISESGPIDSATRWRVKVSNQTNLRFEVEVWVSCVQQN